MTVFFCDMKGFTGLSEGMTPKGMVKVMNRYLAMMSEPVRRHRGIIDKYIGDAIMAFWGPPFTEDGSRRAGLSAGLEIGRGAGVADRIAGTVAWAPLGAAASMRIGVATGEILVGNIGSDFPMSYTVMGDAVNLASRLEGANKAYGSDFAGARPPTIKAARRRGRGCPRDR